jgi:hypothetical protein
LGIITVRDSPEEPPPELAPCEPKADQLADPAHPDATNATHINALMAATLVHPSDRRQRYEAMWSVDQ